MGGLSVIPIPNQSLLIPEQVDELSKFLKSQNVGMWLGTAAQIAQWWRERERIGVRLQLGARAPELVVTVSDGLPLSASASILLNLPEPGDKLRLVAKTSAARLPQVASVDDWRSAILLDQLPAGEHYWELHFDKHD
jgi:hypothetical protein